MIIKVFKLNIKALVAIVACLCMVICIAALMISGHIDVVRPVTRFFATESETEFSEKIETDLSEKADMAVFLTAARETKMIEIFDVGLERVAKKIIMDDEYRKSAEEFIGSITGMYVKVKALPTTGFIVRLPLEPPVSVKNKWFSGEVDEVFVLFPENEKPYLLLLNERNQPLFFNFESNTDNFLTRLDYTPQPSESPQITG